jgi:hypothetical protein
MQQYGEEAVDEHMHALQDLFNKDCKKKKNAPFAWNVNQKEIENIMNSAMKRSERWRNMKEDGLSEDKIKAAFQVPIKMRVYSNRGDIDTTLSPYGIRFVTIKVFYKLDLWQWSQKRDTLRLGLVVSIINILNTIT